MYTGFIICAVIAAAFGRPQDVNQMGGQPLPVNNLQHSQQPQYSPKSQANVTIVNKTEQVNEDGSFSFSFETSDGVRVQQNGFLKKSDNLSRSSAENAQEGDGLIQVLMGGYSYTAPNGEQVQVQYIADENGYQPQGSHVPSLPSVPGNIARSFGQTNNTPQQYDQVVTREVSQEQLGQSDEQLAEQQSV